MPCFESKVSRGQREFTQWNREGERGRERGRSEKREQKQQQTDSEGEKIEKERHCRTNSAFTSGEGGLLRRSNDGKHRGRVRKRRTGGRGGGTHEEVSVRLKSHAEECQSPRASGERPQVPLCVSRRSADRPAMRSGYEATRRRGGGGGGGGGAARVRSLRRGASQGTPPSVFCCHGSSAVGEERHLSIRRSHHR